MASQQIVRRHVVGLPDQAWVRWQTRVRTRIEHHRPQARARIRRTLSLAVTSPQR